MRGYSITNDFFCHSEHPQWMRGLSDFFYYRKKRIGFLVAIAPRNDRERHSLRMTGRWRRWHYHCHSERSEGSYKRRGFLPLALLGVGMTEKKGLESLMEVIEKIE